MSSTASVASQPPVSYRPPVDNDRAQVAKAADDKADDKASEKAAKVEDVQATAAKAQASKEAGKGQVLDIQA
jgi:hypothetical protein